MAANPHVKSLKGFDPKTALAVDESFVNLINQGGEMLDSGGDEMLAAPGSERSGKESGSLRTGGAIHASCSRMELNDGRVIFSAANIKGQIVFFEPDGDGLRECGGAAVQGSLYTQPAYSSGILYCVAREGAAYAIELSTGELKAGDGSVSGEIIWQKKMNKGIFTGPVATGKVLIVTPADGIYAFDAFNGPERRIGAILWGESINGVVSTPVINSGMLFIGTEEKKLLAFDYSGTKLKKTWEYIMGGACRTKPFVSEKSGQVVAGATDGIVYSVAREKGEYRWNFIVNAPVLSPVVSAQTGNGECLLFGADNGMFYSLDQQGRKVWEFRAKGKIRTEALVHEGRVYFGSEDNSLYALDVASGRQVFRFQADGNVYATPVVHEGRLYFGSTDGFIHSVFI